MDIQEYENLEIGDIIVFNDRTEATIEGRTEIAGQIMMETNVGDFGKTVLLSPDVQLKKRVA